MSLLRTWGVAALASVIGATLAALYFLAPWMIETTLESAGSEINRAKVDVASVDVDLLPLKLTIEGVDIADPQAPHRNRFSWKVLSAAPNLHALLWKKWVLDEVQILGLEPGTKRTTSGELEDDRFSKHLPQWTLPSADNLNIDELLSSNTLQTDQRLKALNELSQALQAKWTKKLNPQIWKQRVEGLKQRFDVLRSRAENNRLAVLKDAAKWKALQQDLEGLRTELGQLKHELSKDKQRLQKALTNAKLGPDADVQALLAKVGLGEPDAVSDSWLQSAIKPLIEKVVANLSVEKEATSQEQPDKQPAERPSLLADKTPWPDFLVRKLSGQGQWRGVELSLQGTDLAFPPWQWGQPATLDLTLSGEAEGRGHFISSWSSPVEMRSSWNLDIKQLPLQDYALAKTSSGIWMLKEARLNLKWEGKATLERLDTNLQMTLQHPQWGALAHQEGWEARLLRALQQRDSLTITVKATGSLTSPSMQITTPIKALLRDVIKGQIQEQLEPVKLRLREQLTNRMGNLSDLQGQLKSLDQFDALLQEQLSLLQNMKQGWKGGL